MARSERGVRILSDPLLYSQRDVADLVAYAKERGVRVVPETGLGILRIFRVPRFGDTGPKTFKINPKGFFRAAWGPQGPRRPLGAPSLERPQASPKKPLGPIHSSKDFLGNLDDK